MAKVQIIQQSKPGPEAVLVAVGSAKGLRNNKLHRIEEVPVYAAFD